MAPQHPGIVSARHRLCRRPVGRGIFRSPAQLDCRLCSIAERVLKFLDAVGVSSFDLLGTSHGGAVAMTVTSMCASRSDLRLRKLILVAPVNPWSSHGRRLAPFVGSPLGSTLFLRSVNHMRWTFPYWLARLYGDSKRIPPGTLGGISSAGVGAGKLRIRRRHRSPLDRRSARTRADHSAALRNPHLVDLGKRGSSLYARLRSSFAVISNMRSRGLSGSRPPSLRRSARAIRLDGDRVPHPGIGRSRSGPLCESIGVR